MIRLIGFDGDNTLWDFEASMRVALQATLEELWTIRPGPRTDSLTVDQLIEIRNRVASELSGRVSDLAVVRHAAFERTLEECGIVEPGLAARLNAMFFAVRATRTDPYEDARPSLEALSGRYRTALLTNGNTDPSQYGLAEFLDPIIHAGVEGLAKPDPAIFRLMLDRAAVAPEDSVFVGDSLTDDICGAQAVGLRAIWLNRAALPNETNWVPDAEVESLIELEALLDEWGDQNGSSR